MSQFDPSPVKRVAGVRDRRTPARAHRSTRLLDDPEIDGSTILAVVLEEGETRIGRLNEAGRSALRDHLYTAGELLRLNQLSPDHGVSPLGSEISLFSEKPGE